MTKTLDEVGDISRYSSQPEVEVWKKQGRNDEQIYGAVNFLTGQGALMIDRLIREARMKDLQQHSVRNQRR